MVVPQEFLNLLKTEFAKTIDSVSKDNYNFQKDWNCTSEYDFLYGWHSGNTDAYFVHLFEKAFDRVPDEEECGQMRDIIFLMSDQLKDALNKRLK